MRLFIITTAIFIGFGASAEQRPLTFADVAHVDGHSGSAPIRVQAAVEDRSVLTAFDVAEDHTRLRARR